MRIQGKDKPAMRLLTGLTARIVVLTLVLPLFPAIYAEQKASAWVLWSENHIVKGYHQMLGNEPDRLQLDVWQIIEAYATLAECRQELERYAKERAEPPKETPPGMQERKYSHKLQFSQHRGRVTIVHGGDASLIMTLRCLPDTIDPRR
jgi:hypothetical protein